LIDNIVWTDTKVFEIGFKFPYDNKIDA